MGPARARAGNTTRGLKIFTPRLNWNMQDLGKLLFAVGLLVALMGAWLWSGRGLGWLGRLPGDISYQNGDFRFYFPVTTCILVSIVLTLVALFFRR